MGIIAINVNTTGLVGQQIEPRRCTLITTDSLATITTAGYLNNQNLLGNTIMPTDIFDILYDFNEQTKVGTFGIFQVTYSASTGFTLNIWENPGNVLLPVTSGDFAVFNGTSGQIKDLGYLPSDAAKTRVVMAGSAVQIGYLAKYVDVNGTVDDTAGAAINAGDLQAGLAGTAGKFISYPSTAANGQLILEAINAGADFDTTIRNAASVGQDQIVTIPDIGAATGWFLAAGATLVTGEFPVFSGALGRVISSGVAASNIQNKTNIIAAQSADIGGGGAGPINIVDANVTAASVIVASIVSSSNVVAVAKVAPGAGSFDVTFDGDPGAACVISYVIFVAAQ